ncbi:MAG: YitT family protein [Clostridia bacterium]|nr:YitT family protein [Clostridia bacterium]
MKRFKIRWVYFIPLFFAGIINAVGVTLFLAPLRLFDSGISGTAFLLDVLTPEYLMLGMFLIVLNVPFFLLAYKKVGWHFIIYSLYAIAVYSGSAFLFQNILPIDFTNGSPFVGNDILLGALFGGLLSGIGSGMVIRFGGAIDGVEVMAVLFAKKLGMTVGTFMMVYNVILYSVAALIFQSWNIPLYSIIAYAIGNKTIDYVVDGFDKGNSVFIVAKRTSDLPALLSEELGRGVTVLESYGGYSGEEKMMIYCVVNRFELGRVKRTVMEFEPEAFMSVGDVSETVGGKTLRFSFLKRGKK